MNQSTKILVLSFSNLKSDPRVKRQIRYLADKSKVTCAGFSNPEIENATFVDISFKLNKLVFLLRLWLLVFRLFNWYYWSLPEVRKAKKQLVGKDFDLIIANDADMLPLALKIANASTKVIFDAHEYAPLEHDDDWKWRLLFKGYKVYLIQHFAHKAHAMFTVCEGIAIKFKHVFDLNAKVMTNASEYAEIAPKVTSGPKIRLIHHGMAHPTRKIENMIQMMDFVDDRFELDLMLVFTKSTYMEQLKELAKGKSNIRFIDAVTSDKIVSFTAEYDLGLYILEPTNFNNANALPNKLFEFIQSRLGIAIGPSPEMQRIVEANSIGIVANDFLPETLAKVLNQLSLEDIQTFKSNAHQLAVNLNASKNMELLQSEIDRLFI
jgi:hypothetical protein